MAGWTFQRRGLAAGCIWRQFCVIGISLETFVFIFANFMEALKQKYRPAAINLPEHGIYSYFIY